MSTLMLVKKYSPDVNPRESVGYCQEENERPTITDDLKQCYSPIATTHRRKEAQPSTECIESNRLFKRWRILLKTFYV